MYKFIGKSIAKIDDKWMLDTWLKETAFDPYYWKSVKAKAEELGSDGCTLVTELFHNSCLEHDIHFRTHKLLCSCPISFGDANYVMKVRTQQQSYFGKYSPIAMIRYLALNYVFRFISKRAWNH